MSNLPKSLTTVTTVSKTIAAILFIALPIIFFFLGVNYQSQLDSTIISQLQVQKNLQTSP